MIEAKNLLNEQEKRILFIYHLKTRLRKFNLNKLIETKKAENKQENL